MKKIFKLTVKKYRFINALEQSAWHDYSLIIASAKMWAYARVMFSAFVITRQVSY